MQADLPFANRDRAASGVLGSFAGGSRVSLHCGVATCLSAALERCYPLFRRSAPRLFPPSWGRGTILLREFLSKGAREKRHAFSEKCRLEATCASVPALRSPA
jgi:hypothetical protein